MAITCSQLHVNTEHHWLISKACIVYLHVHTHTHTTTTPTTTTTSEAPNVKRTCKRTPVHHGQQNNTQCTNQGTADP